MDKLRKFSNFVNEPILLEDIEDGIFLFHYKLSLRAWCFTCGFNT